MILDMSKPFECNRQITEIHLHHEGGGTELNDVDDVERGALSRTDIHFSEMPYNILIHRLETADDAKDEPIRNLWVASVGRDFEKAPASIKEYGNHSNATAIAICVAGRWDNQPLPRWAEELLIDVVIWLCNSLRLPIDSVYGHREVARPGYTVCPGYDPGHVRTLAVAQLEIPY